MIGERRGTLVVVEDFLVARLVRAVLGKKGYDVILASPPEAVRLLRASVDSNHMLITNSPALFLEFAPSIPLLYLTSSPDPQIQTEFRKCRVVRKPFLPAELVQAITELDGSPSSS